MHAASMKKVKRVTAKALVIATVLLLGFFLPPGLMSLHRRDAKEEPLLEARKPESTGADKNPARRSSHLRNRLELQQRRLHLRRIHRPEGQQQRTGARQAGSARGGAELEAEQQERRREANLQRLREELRRELLEKQVRLRERLMGQNDAEQLDDHRERLGGKLQQQVRLRERLMDQRRPHQRAREARRRELQRLRL